MHTPHSLARARPLTRLGALIVVVLAAALAAPFMSNADASGTRCYPGSPTLCMVTEPDVTQYLTSYPQIQLYAGQRVSFAAGGCYQTGGRGKTWKRFVHPLSDNLSLYKGEVYIPGTVVPIFLSDVENATFTVQRNTPLSIGVNDDNYSDNGYWGRAGDDGTENQCVGYPNAWVQVFIYN
jgi:hypothetical protein